MNIKNIANYLIPTESIIYECCLDYLVEDANLGHPEKYEDYAAWLVLTNYRVILCLENELYSTLLSAIKYVSIIDGYENGDSGVGTGEYAIVIENDTYWFYSDEVRDTFYKELVRVVID